MKKLYCGEPIKVDGLSFLADTLHQVKVVFEAYKRTTRDDKK